MSKTRSDVDESEASSYDLGALAEFNQFFSDLIKARRANPTDDIASLIANARVDDKLLPDWDVARQYIAILTAGHDTTSSSTAGGVRSEEHTSELQSLMRISYAVFCFKKKKKSVAYSTTKTQVQK